MDQQRDLVDHCRRWSLPPAPMRAARLPSGATMSVVDRDEQSDAPVVSLSIVELVSGDLFVFGGPSRLAFHGVPKVHPGTGDPDTGLPAGRLNLTMRVTGLT